MAADPFRIGKYRVIRRVGQGAQGSVYLAQRDHAAHLSVVKQRHASASDARFRREAQICSLLEHRNIARIEAAVFDGDEAYLAFEDVMGVEVQALYDRHQQLGRSIPAPVVLHILDGVLTGLEFAHSALDSAGNPAGLVHRDLNFGNVMVGFDGVPKIIDFGLARNAGGAETKPGFALGTPAYMPPEFLTLGAQAASPASDVYSAGLMAYDLLMAIDYDVSRGDSQTFWKWIMDPTPLPPIMDHRSDVPRGAAEAIHRAFRPRIQDRWPSARAFLEAVRAALPPSSVWPTCRWPSTSLQAFSNTSHPCNTTSSSSSPVTQAPQRESLRQPRALAKLQRAQHYWSHPRWTTRPPSNALWSRRQPTPRRSWFAARAPTRPIGPR